MELRPDLRLEMAQKGKELKTQWPEASNVLSISTTEQLSEQLRINPVVTISEKLDGSNILLSSDKWIASRRVILVENMCKNEWSKTKFNHSDISNLKKFSTALDSIKNELAERLCRSDFEIFVYGEWLQYRTASTQQDRFKYEERGFKTKNFYAFGMAVHFQKELAKSETIEIEKELETLFKWNLMRTQKPLRFIIINFDKNLQIFLQGKGFECVPWLGQGQLLDVLKNKDFVDRLLKQDIEGFVLTGENLLWKWKFIEKGDKTSQVEAIAELRKTSEDKLITSVIDSLEAVCLNSTPIDDISGPRKRPSKQLYASLFKSAETKFPKIEDLCNRETSENTILVLGEDFKKKFIIEIEEDFCKTGYRLTEEFKSEISKFVNSIFDRRVLNCIQRKNAKPNTKQ